jgi:REP element-mobilizing transposase RayT
MPRAKRLDGPDTWHHVFNRAVSKRPLFLCRGDLRFFLSCLAREVRRRIIEIHAYALMLNHFHLLVRSLRGRLDRAMLRIQTRYARYLNRRLKRDGALLKNRYKSRRVTTDTYHRNLVGYIDSNPIKAKSVGRPERYPWGSASKYADKKRPRWLTTSWIDGVVREHTGHDARRVEAYRRVFPARCDPDFVDWMERRLSHTGKDQDDLDFILGANPGQVRGWMRRKAKLADGEAQGLPVAGAAAVLAAIGEMAPSVEQLAGTGPAHARRPSPLDLLRVGLLRDVAALSWREIAELLDCADSTAHGRCVLHRRTVITDDKYATLAARSVALAVKKTIGQP